MMVAVREHKGQRYTCTAAVPFTRKDGTLSAVLTWQSDCAECGAAFSFKMGATKFEPNRRCRKHSQPGNRVGGGDGKCS